MTQYVENLEKRFKMTLESGSDSRFYQNLHLYFDFIIKTPKLNELWESGQRSYYERFNEIWDNCLKDDVEIDRRALLVSRLERFSFFAAGAKIWVRVYLPIEEYKHSKESEDKQDPVAMLMIRGIDDIIPKTAQDKIRDRFIPKLFRSKLPPVGRWNRERLELYNRWFDGKRGTYEETLRQFHLMFLDAIEKSKPEIEEVETAQDITFDEERSTLHFFGKIVPLSLKNDKTDGHYLIAHLLKSPSERLYYGEAPKDIFGDDCKWMKFYNAAKNIETKIAKETTIKNFLIIKSGKSGYVQIEPSYLDKLRFQ